MRRHRSPELDELDANAFDWNVIVTVRPHHFRAAYDLLEGLGEVAATAYHNVLALKVADVGEFLEALHDWMETYPDTGETIAHVGPCVETFTFDSPEEFETKVKEAAIQFDPKIMGRRFHVRMYRRGWKGRLQTPHEERLLGECLHEMVKINPHSRIDFEDPDVILAVEVLDHRAGVALWTRANRTRYPFLNVD